MNALKYSFLALAVALWATFLPGACASAPYADDAEDGAATDASMPAFDAGAGAGERPKHAAFATAPSGFGVYGSGTTSGISALTAINGDAGFLLTSVGTGGTPVFAPAPVSLPTPFIAGDFLTNDGGVAYWAPNSVDWTAPGTIGSVTPNTGKFTTLQAASQAGTTTAVGDAGGTMSVFTDRCIKTAPTGDTSTVHSCEYQTTTSDGVTWTKVTCLTAQNNGYEGDSVTLLAGDFSWDGGTGATGNAAFCDLRWVVYVSNQGSMRVTPEFGDNAPNTTSPQGLVNLSCTGANNDAGGVGPAVTYRVTWSGLSYCLETLGLASTTVKQVDAVQRAAIWN